MLFLREFHPSLARYVTGVLEDARVYSGHAKKKALDMEDVKLAVQLAAEQGFTSPPPREVTSP